MVLLVKGRRLAKLFPLVKAEWNNPEYNHAAWFYGLGGYPLSAGYFAGYKLLQTYKNSCKQTYNECVDLPYDVFINIPEEIII